MKTNNNMNYEYIYTVASHATNAAIKAKKSRGSVIAETLYINKDIDGISKDDLIHDAVIKIIEANTALADELTDDLLNDWLYHEYIRIRARTDKETGEKIITAALEKNARAYVDGLTDAREEARRVLRFNAAFNKITAIIAKMQRTHSDAEFNDAVAKDEETRGNTVSSFTRSAINHIVWSDFLRLAKNNLPAVEWQVVRAFHIYMDSPTRADNVKKDEDKARVYRRAAVVPPKYDTIRAYIGAPDMSDNELRVLLQRTRRHLRAVASKCGLTIDGGKIRHTAADPALKSDAYKAAAARQTTNRVATRRKPYASDFGELIIVSIFNDVPRDKVAILPPVKTMDDYNRK